MSDRRAAAVGAVIGAVVAAVAVWAADRFGWTHD